MNLLSLPRNIKDLSRTRQIVTILVKQGFKEIVEKARLARLVKLKIPISGEAKETTPQRVRETLEKLGPTFVKLGQVLSLRPDLIPQHYCDEFKKLQDDVPPLPFAVIKGVIESELKGPIKQYFKSIKTAPLAAASVAQVHEAKLKNGERVALKVQRPGVGEVMRQDISIMAFFARHIEKQYPEILFTEIVSEFAKYTDRELDMTQEAKAMRQIGDYFTENEEVVIPTAFTELSTERLLVIEYLNGVRLSDTAKLKRSKHDMKNLLRIGFETMFKMIYELGIFHADPHPGNMIAVWRSTGEEKHEALAFIDFGIVGYITKEQQRDLLLFLNALVNGDVPGVTRAVMRLGVEGERVSPRKLEQIIGSSLAKWRGNNLGEEPLSHIAFLVIQRCIKERVAFPADVILLVKAYVTMEGSARWLDPELDFTGMAKPLLAAYFKNEYGPSWIKDEVSKDAISLQNIIRELPYAANILMRSVERGKVEIALDKNEFIKWEKLEELQTSKKSLALIAGSFFMGSAMIAGFAPSLSWGGLPLYQLGFLLFLITLCMFIIVSITTHKYVEHQWKER